MIIPPPPFNSLDEVASIPPSPFATREEYVYSLNHNWGGNGEALFDTLVASGCVERAPSGRYRVYEEDRGKQLSQKLAEDLAEARVRLLIDDNSQAGSVLVQEQEPATSNSSIGLFNYYRGPITNTKPYAEIRLPQLCEVVKSPTFAAKTAQLRALPPGKERDEFKKTLDYVTPAGIFTKRDNKQLVASSGMMVLDFDHVPDLIAARTALLSDPLLGSAITLLFTSPSGDGLKCLITTDTEETHLENFRAISAYLTAHYASLGLVPDKSGKDVARATFVCHDPEAYLNPAYAA